MTDAIGYSFNNGGLNNQRLALLGLFISGYLKKKTIILPLMYKKDVYQENNSIIPLQNSTISIFSVFDEEGMRYFANKYKIEIENSDPSLLQMGGWEYFGAGAGAMSALALNSERYDISEFVLDFFVNVVPLARSSYALSCLKQDLLGKTSRTHRLFSNKKSTIAVQFRIESDWQFYSAVTLLPTIGNDEDYNITYEQILKKITISIPYVKNIIAIYDESAVLVQKEEIRHTSKKNFDINIMWKSDFFTPFETKNLGPLALSMIDFELAVAADGFVGLSRSTFSNMVTFEKFVARRSSVTTDYIYNTNHAYLGLRTDNGGHADPRDATK